MDILSSIKKQTLLNQGCGAFIIYGMRGIFCEKVDLSIFN
jgi:hypothetical protein